MLLADATSKQQVEAALEAGDEELEEDIADQLRDARREWERNAGTLCEDILISDSFITGVIGESGETEYDLSQIPREVVDREMNRIAKRDGTPRAGGRMGDLGPFSPSEHAGFFGYRVEPSMTCFFPEHLLPENAECIPADIAESFWEDVGGYEWETTDAVVENTAYATDSYNEAYLSAKEGAFIEFCRDLFAEHIQDQVKKDPKGVIAMFLGKIDEGASTRPTTSEILVQSGMGEEEMLDLASNFLMGNEDDRSTVREDILEYIAAIADPGSQEREIVAEYSRDDLKRLGIKGGTLFEEAPWRLIKLLPFDLKLEGTMMRNCVGDRGMGYAKAVKDGDIEIWSLRSRANKPRFTLEVDSSFYDPENERLRREADGDPHHARALTRAPGPRGATETLDRYRSRTQEWEAQRVREIFERARAVKQLKGKGNRTPGYAGVNDTLIKFPEEVLFWTDLLSGIGVDPLQVHDMGAARVLAYEAASHAQEHEGRPQEMRPNGEVCTGFDMPYRPLRAARKTRRR